MHWLKWLVVKNVKASHFLHSFLEWTSYLVNGRLFKNNTSAICEWVLKVIMDCFNCNWHSVWLDPENWLSGFNKWNAKVTKSWFFISILPQLKSRVSFSFELSQAFVYFPFIPMGCCDCVFLWFRNTQFKGALSERDVILQWFKLVWIESVTNFHLLSSLLLFMFVLTL